MTRIVANRKMWTRDDVKLLHKLWKSKTIKEICEEMNINNTQLQYIIFQMRKAGINLPRKHVKGHLNNLLYEMAHELNRE